MKTKILSLFILSQLLFCQITPEQRQQLINCVATPTANWWFWNWCYCIRLKLGVCPVSDGTFDPSEPITIDEWMRRGHMVSDKPIIKTITCSLKPNSWTFNKGTILFDLNCNLSITSTTLTQFQIESIKSMINRWILAPVWNP